MKINKIFFEIALAFMVAALFGCTTIYPLCWFGCSDQFWYEQIQLEEKNKCSYQKSQKAMETCLENLDKRTYEDYKIERKRSGATLY